MIRIGHKGAAALAPENTLRSIERALELGVDMVEVDVVPLADGTLVLAHSDDLLEVTHGAAPGRVTNESLAELRVLAPELPTLDEALAFMAGRDAGIQLDVKAPGYEEPLVKAVGRHGLAGRTLVSSCYAETLRTVARLDPRLRCGLTYPFDRRGVSTRSVLRPVVGTALRMLRAALPRRIGRLLARADATVAVLHYAVVSRAVVRRCHEHGAQVLVWTVDDPALCDRLAAVGVDGIITNDPRIFRGTL
ncbi:MAG: glycerophosphodiester phosphodiesterase [Gaiellaceae bacterium]